MISPCIRQCRIDQETKICSGCGRTLDEVIGWSKYTDEERQSIMDRLKDK